MKQRKSISAKTIRHTDQSTPKQKSVTRNIFRLNVFFCQKLRWCMFNFVRIAKQREKLIAQLSSETSASCIRFVHLFECFVLYLHTRGAKNTRFTVKCMPRMNGSEIFVSDSFSRFTFHIVSSLAFYFIFLLFFWPPHFKCHFPILFSFVPFISDPFSGESSLVTFIYVRVFSPLTVSV